ncbi:hypothetical protein [Salipiger thiooxidans]|uniref:hypothetical protein n=1 Tax=Salipiger thiooxidans TaxID=282683 RepID=UPI001CD64701|nr:hypothetical protein [Salipiger thiooxidans]MCA0848613.1 hypothetical protein [Salipiger thiooxidans]
MPRRGVASPLCDAREGQGAEGAAAGGAGPLGRIGKAGFEAVSFAVTIIAFTRSADRLAEDAAVPGPAAGCSFGNGGAIGPDTCTPFAMPGTLRKIPKWSLDPDGPVTVSKARAMKSGPRILRWLLTAAMILLRPFGITCFWIWPWTDLPRLEGLLRSLVGLGQALPVLPGVVTPSFLVLRRVPGDPVAVIAATATDAAKAGFRGQLGLDQPILHHYLVFLAIC